MKFDVTTRPTFEPFTVAITLETEDEARFLLRAAEGAADGWRGIDLEMYTFNFSLAKQIEEGLSQTN